VYKVLKTGSPTNMPSLDGANEFWWYWLVPWPKDTASLFWGEWVENSKGNSIYKNTGKSKSQKWINSILYMLQRSKSGTSKLGTSRVARSRESRFSSLESRVSNPTSVHSAYVTGTHTNGIHSILHDTPQLFVNCCGYDPTLVVLDHNCMSWNEFLSIENFGM
jgi:hypothetical protein